MLRGAEEICGRNVSAKKLVGADFEILFALTCDLISTRRDVFNSMP